MTVLTALREIEALINAKTGPFAYQMIAGDFEHQLRAWIHEIGAGDLLPKIVVTHGESICTEILGVAEGTQADLIIVAAHRPAMKDYLLGTNAGRDVRHARCSVLVVRE